MKMPPYCSKFIATRSEPRQVEAAAFAWIIAVSGSPPPDGPITRCLDDGQSCLEVAKDLKNQMTGHIAARGAM